MYVSSGSACTERNSQTPMDPRAIAAQARRVARVGNQFVRGNVALNTLVQTLGGVGIGDNVPGVTELAMAADFRNSPGCSSSISGDGSLYGGRIAVGSQGPGLDEGGAFLPVSMGGNVLGSPPVAGSPSVASLATVAAAAAVATAAASGVPVSTAGPGTSPQGSNGPGGLPWNFNTRGRMPGRDCPPMLLPMMTVFPIPATWSTRGGVPAGTPPAVAARPAPAAAAPSPGGKTGPGSNTAPAAGAPTRPTTGNLCLDLVLNYALPSQVSQPQLLKCAMLNYQGTRNGPLLTTAYQTWRNQNAVSLPSIPDQPNVPEYTQALGKQYGLAGFGAGLGDDGSCLCLVLAVAAVAGGVWWAYENQRGR